MRKLTESIKIYEHVLSKDSVMDHFRSIISKVLRIILFKQLAPLYFLNVTPLVYKLAISSIFATL